MLFKFKKNRFFYISELCKHYTSIYYIQYISYVRNKECCICKIDISNS